MYCIFYTNTHPLHEMVHVPTPRKKLKNWSKKLRSFFQKKLFFSINISLCSKIVHVLVSICFGRPIHTYAHAHTYVPRPPVEKLKKLIKKKIRILSSAKKNYFLFDQYTFCRSNIVYALANMRGHDPAHSTNHCIFWTPPRHTHIRKLGDNVYVTP